MGYRGAVEETYVERRVEPVATDQVVREHVVEHRTVPITTRGTVWSRTFNPAAVLAVILSVVLGVVGAVAIARAGLQEPLGDPIVEVAGFTHTAVLGLIEVAMAVILLAVGLSRDRGAILFVSILFGAAALVAAIEPTVGGASLSIEQSWAVVLVIAFALLAVVAALAPTFWESRRRVDSYVR